MREEGQFTIPRLATLKAVNMPAREARAKNIRGRVVELKPLAARKGVKCFARKGLRLAVGE